MVQLTGAAKNGARALQLLLADRLTEAREEALNGHVFRIVLDEYQTRLAAEHDLVPLTRRNGRTGITDGIAQNIPAVSAAFQELRQDLGVSMTRSVPQVARTNTPSLPFSPGRKALGGKPQSANGDATESPRICAEDVRQASTTTQAVAEASTAGNVHPVAAVRRRYYGRDGDDSLARLVSMHSGLPA